MLSRRAFALAAAAAPALAIAAPSLSEDGLYHEPWFLESLLELGDDLKEATDRKKRLAVMWELKGCPACRDTHLLNFSQPAISEYVQKHFEIVQLNIIGSRTVTDFDGEKLAEKRLAEKYGIRFTPTFQFFMEDADLIGKKAPRERESARGQGYLKPPQFLAMFRFVSEKIYEKQQLAEYLRSVS